MRTRSTGSSCRRDEQSRRGQLWETRGKQGRRRTAQRRARRRRERRGSPRLGGG